MADDRRHASTRPYPPAADHWARTGPRAEVVYAQAVEEFQRLSAHAIRALIIGNVITDEAHWSHHFRPDGTLHAIVLA
jgi:hypothetical protein